jgi:extradiol dioxygenase family protein
MSIPIFHIAIPITDIEQAKDFYHRGLGCAMGRANEQAIIFDFYGSQLVTHMTDQDLPPQKGIYPRHFGLVLNTKTEWDQILAHCQAQNLNFYQNPKLRFPDRLTEHHTFFLIDPFGNMLEFKFYVHREAIFGGQQIDEIGDRD